MTNYSWKITVGKGIKQALIFGLPLLIAYLANFYPAISGLTVGAILTMLFNWIKNK